MVEAGDGVEAEDALRDPHVELDLQRPALGELVRRRHASAGLVVANDRAPGFVDVDPVDPPAQADVAEAKRLVRGASSPSSSNEPKETSSRSGRGRIAVSFSVSASRKAST